MRRHRAAALCHAMHLGLLDVKAATDSGLSCNGGYGQDALTANPG